MIRTNHELLDFFSKNCEENEFIKYEQFHPGKKIINQGSLVRGVYIIEKGIGKCYVEEENGKIFIQEFFGKGEILGEVEIFDDALSFSNVEAVTRISAYRIEKNDFYKLIEKKNEFGIILFKAMAVKLRNTAKRASSQQSYPLEYNLKKLLQLSSAETEHISKNDMASYLGITLRSLNRKIKQIQKNDP
ncbi:Crp/Fnr family transcriptional regulator [Aquimarina gracilis]|uniref:Crp/Fnr family transcriptional regulator n=1 Tax=Aquimarina gracilis TaxID=874422 RepID=A0ABU5ZZP9_9FLAO|nr:Crp/Fnr family transcriptional regulator [Aquimarina gracilis]MEB3347374.1 Crp/Fnr family transcriptional regulator [Aquimarina gracilis]